MSAEDDLLAALETHAVHELRSVLDAGLDVQAPIRGRRPVQWLTDLYTRSDRFPACLRLLLERGAKLDDPWLEPVLLNDGPTLRRALRERPELLRHRSTLRSAFTPLDGASLLHVAAEFGHLEVTEVLVEAGVEVDARAAVDPYGLNGHSALFHTVNSNGNRSRPVMERLLAAGADPTLRVSGITWGRGFEWETTCFDQSPISYAQLGLLPQMHRVDSQVHDNLELLLAAAGRPVPPRVNVPNAYLAG